MKTDKITREDLRAMRHGETRIFELPSVSAIDSGKTSAYALARLEGCTFQCVSDFNALTLTITRYDNR